MLPEAALQSCTALVCVEREAESSSESLLGAVSSEAGKNSVRDEQEPESRER